MSEKHELRFLELTPRLVEISDREGVQFAIDFLYDHFMLRGIKLDGAFRVLQENDLGTPYERNMGLAYPWDEAVLEVIKTLEQELDRR